MAEVWRGDRLHVLAERCATCVFRPGNLMHLEPGRLAGMVRECLRDPVGGHVPCHETIHGSPHPPAVCRGFWDAHRSRVALLRLAEERGLVEEDPAPERSPWDERG